MFDSLSFMTFDDFTVLVLQIYLCFLFFITWLIILIFFLGMKCCFFVLVFVLRQLGYQHYYKNALLRCKFYDSSTKTDVVSKTFAFFANNCKFLKTSLKMYYNIGSWRTDVECKNNMSSKGMRIGSLSLLIFVFFLIFLSLNFRKP